MRQVKIGQGERGSISIIVSILISLLNSIPSVHFLFQPPLTHNDDGYHHILSFAHDRWVRLGNGVWQQSDAVLVLLLCKDIRRSFTSTLKNSP